MKTKLILLAALFGLFGFSCQKNNDPTPDADFACDKQAKITSQVLGDIPISFAYDAKGRINKVFRTDGKGLDENYKYTNDTTVVITRNFSDGSVGNKFNAILTPQGYVKKYFTVETTPDMAFSNTYTYNAEGRLTENIYKFGNPVQTYRTTYVYEAGNLKSAQTYLNGKLNYSEAYKYRSEANKADVGFNRNQPGMYGRYSANLVDSFEINYADGTKERYAYTYELNKNGFVKIQNQTYTDQANKITTRANTYEYICQ